MEPGETYTISGWIKLDGADSDEVAITIRQVDGDGTRYHRVAVSTGYDSRWTQFGGGFTLNVVGTLSSLDMYFEGPQAGVSYFLDDVEVLPPGPPPDPLATGQVDVSTVFQELEGFGASGAWYENWLTAHKKKSELYDVLFDELGLDIYRIRNLYDISTSSINRTQEIVAAAKARNPMLKIMISSWSPPAYLKSDANTIGGTLKKDPNGNYMYNEFAEWWAESLDEYSSRGINPDYMNMQNEPDFLTDWDTCKFTPTESEDWAGYNLAFEAVYEELDSRMAEQPKLLAPEACGCGNSQAYIDALIDPNHVYGFAHHHYSDGGYDFPDSLVPAMENFAENYGYKPLFQTEYSRGTGEESFSAALNLARHMHNSLVHEGTCAFLYWDLFWGESGGLVTIPSYGSSSYTINHTYYAFKQYSAFTDPGWRRVDASTDSSGLRISAFTNPDVNELSIVIINISEVDIALNLSMGDFSPDSSAVYRTSETENTKYLGTLSEWVLLTRESVTTLSLTGSFSPENCSDVQTAGFGFTSDTNGDCYVNYSDFHIISQYWLNADCSGPTNCEGADFEPDNDVDLFDLSTFALQWMQCNDPEDTNCTQNW